MVSTQVLDVQLCRNLLETDARVSAKENGHSLGKFYVFGRGTVSIAYCRVCGASVICNTDEETTRCQVCGVIIERPCICVRKMLDERGVVTDEPYYDA